MKNLLVGLVVLGSLTLHAQVDCGATINELEIFRATNKLEVLEAELGRNGYVLTSNKDAEVKIELQNGVSIQDGSLRGITSLGSPQTYAKVSLVNHNEVNVTAYTKTKYFKSVSRIERKIQKLRSKKTESVSESKKNTEELQKLRRLSRTKTNDAEADEYISVIKKLPSCASLKD
jgi:hypothetical protein